MNDERFDPDIEDELEHHLEQRALELAAEGMPLEEARAEARRRFGNVATVRREMKRIADGDERRRHIGWILAAVRQDLLVGFRRLAGSPGFAAIAILTLALGIGATSAIFSVLHAIVLQPLDFHEPERLVQVWESSPARGWDYFAMSQPNYLDFRDGASSLESLTAQGFRTFNLTGLEEPLRLTAFTVTADFFATLGVEPILGRSFTADEDAVGSGARVVIVSEDFWSGTLGRDPGVIGRTLQLNGEDYRVVGVAPDRSPWFFQIELFVPLRADPNANRGDHRLSAFGRLADGVTVEQAESDLDAVAAILAEKYPDSNVGFDTRVSSLYDAIVPSEVRDALLILQGAVVFVLLIACANLSNLLLARSAGRQREMAIYTALGASRGRIMGQLLTESSLLGLLGGSLGVLLAWLGVRFLRSLEITALPRFELIELNQTVLGFALVVSLLTGLLAGVAPAWQVLRGDLNRVLNEGSRSVSGGRRSARARKVLMAAEVALSIVLLAGAMLLMRSFWQVQRIDPGLDIDRVLTASVNFPMRPDVERGEIGSFYREVVDAVEAVPGVESAAAISGLPFGGGATSMDYVVEGEDLSPEGGVPSAYWRLITPDYFTTVGIPLISGRFFTDADGAQAPNIGIVSAGMAARAWPGENPIGKSFYGWRDPERLIEVVGVVGDVRERNLETASGDIVYLPFYRNDFWPDMYVLARSLREPGTVADGVRGAVNEAAPDVPVQHLRPLNDVLDDTLAGRRLSMGLIGGFAGLALLLAAAGVYGVMAYSVAQRSGELGLRMAMGARAGQVVSLVLSQGMRVVAIGGLAGVVLAFGVTRFLGTMLYDVQPADPLSFAAASAFLIAVALLACTVPALRATRVDPVEALRAD